MSIIINKSGVTVDDVSYGFLQIELDSQLELHYDRVLINTQCFDGLDASNYGLNGHWEPSTYEDPDPSVGTVDVSIWVDPISPIFPSEWQRFNNFEVPFELEASTNLEEWSHEKSVEELTSIKASPYEYMAYEADVFDLDPSSGEPVLDPCTNEPIKLHVKGDLIKKKNGTYQFYTKILPIFCELEDVSIKL